MKHVYISADYDWYDGDQEVVDVLNGWGKDNKHTVEFVDMSKVASGTVANDPDCRICDLKAEFNAQINASSAVIFVVGNKTASRTAGCACERCRKNQEDCQCTPYKANANGKKPCKVSNTCTPRSNDDVGSINSYSYLRHEFEQAKKKNKDIVIVYNSTRNENTWFPWYMKGYEDCAFPFWIYNNSGNRVGNYQRIKDVLGF